MIGRWAVVFFVFTAFLAVSAVGHAREGCTVVVNPGESLQAAIDAAAEGAVICLGEGIWDEHVTITTSLTLRGQGAEVTVLRPQEADWPVVTIHSAGEELLNVVLEGITLTGAHGFWEAHGVLVQGLAHVIIKECAITENGWDGVHARSYAQAHIVAATVSDNQGHGVHVRDGARATVERTRISGNQGYGIYSLSFEVHGEGNALHDNGADLGGNVPGALREPLVPATETRIVYPDPRYPSLQHAVDALVPGGRLILEGGEHTAGLTMTKAVEIEAQPGETVVLRARNPETAVLSLLGGAELTMTGLTLTGGEHGLFMSADARATVRTCVITENRTGIQLQNAAELVVERSTVSAHPLDGIRMSGAAKGTITASTLSSNRCGVYLLGSARATLERTTISRSSWDGVRLAALSPGTAHATIIDCTISDSGNGIHLQGFSEAAVTDCAISNCPTGIRLQGSSEVTILRGTVSYSSTGIALFDSAVASLESVRIIDSSSRGIDLRDRAQATVVGCTLIDRGFGIGVWLEGSAQATIESSSFSGGFRGIRAAGSSNADIRDCTFRDIEYDGMVGTDSASATITGSSVFRSGVGVLWWGGELAVIGCTVSENQYDGIELGSGAIVTIESSTIRNNGGCGVFFNGLYITGRGNRITGNAEGNVCPDDLAFLMTEEGGELDRRE